MQLRGTGGRSGPVYPPLPQPGWAGRENQGKERGEGGIGTLCNKPLLYPQCDI